ncbi:MAG: uncharacterized protein KVP18_001858 [Porospora cf. gigantea A]|uniref:uncharacterized protein n=1 Tax=Porospora cf. gigantea A TaxID=2853593 RepID=UPI003559FFA6|nr:MAG: hypothetical protein KVP18_001858 [Porospora cf. gigantea A]
MEGGHHGGVVPDEVLVVGEEAEQAAQLGQGSRDLPSLKLLYPARVWQEQPLLDDLPKVVEALGEEGTLLQIEGQAGHREPPEHLRQEGQGPLLRSPVDQYVVQVDQHPPVPQVPQEAVNHPLEGGRGVA